MKKKLVATIVIILVVGGIYAYQYHKQTKKEEFMTYYNEVWVPTMAMEEEEISKTYDDIEELYNKGEMEEIAVLTEEEYLPVIEKGLKRFEEVDPENNDIKKMNQLTLEEEKQRLELAEDYREFGNGNLNEMQLKKTEDTYNKKIEELTDYSKELREKYDLVKDSTDTIGKFSKVKPE